MKKRVVGFLVIIIFILNIIIPNAIMVKAVDSKNNMGISIREDVNEDGYIDSLDMSTISVSYNNKSNEESYIERKDINKDGIIDIYDLVKVSKMINTKPFAIANEYEEKEERLKYTGTWNWDENSKHSNGKMLHSASNGSKVELDFYGTGFEWYGVFSPWSGKANIILDGQYLETKDLYLQDNYYDKLVFAKNDLPLGMHKLVIENIGDKNANSNGINVSIDRIVINNPNWKNKNYKVYQSEIAKEVYIGQYNTKEKALNEAKLYFKTYVIDSNNTEVWTNGYAVYQQTSSGQIIYVKRFKTLEEAKTEAIKYKNAYVLDLTGKEVWRGKYESWSNDKFYGRFNTLEEAENVTKTIDYGVIKDVTQNDKIVWSNKFITYQIVQATQDTSNIGEYKTLAEAKTRAEKFANTHIVNGKNEQIWTNGFVVKQSTSSKELYVGRYDTKDSGISKAAIFKNAYVLDPVGKEIWRGRYEAFQGTIFLGRYNTLNEAIEKANQFDETVVKDVLDGDKVVWSKPVGEKPDIDINRVGQIIANFNGGAYDLSASNKWECVWYVRWRAKEKGYSTYNIYGNANVWFTEAKKKGAKVSSNINDIKSNSILCRNNGTYGHVVYIEYVDNSSSDKWIYYTEANVDGGIGDGKQSPGDGKLKKMKFSEFRTKVARENAGFEGYIYLPKL